MTAEGYQQVIMAELEGPTSEVMAEIADFVFFMRRKVKEPNAFAAEREESALHRTLQAGWSESLAHLEEEFADYERLPLPSLTSPNYTTVCLPSVVQPQGWL